MTSSHVRIQVYPFVFVCIALFVLFLAHVQSSKNERLYLLEDIERDDSLITNELEGIEDDGNTFTGEQTNGNDDYEDNTLEETNNNSNNGIATDNEINSPSSLGDGHGIGVDGQLDEENLSSTGISNSLGEFLCPPGKLMSPSMKCVTMSAVPLYTPPIERLNMKIFPDLTDIFDAHKAKGCGRVVAHKMPKTGFGAIVNYAIYEYAQAVKSGNTQFDFASHSLPGFSSKTCGDQSLACYLEPLSKCKRTKVDENQKDFQKAENRAIIMPIRASPSFFYYHAAVAGRLWRPNANFAKKVMELKGKMGWPAPTNAGGETYGTNKVISVHVRKGDSCVAEGRVKKYGSCANFGRYAKEIQRLRNAYGEDVFNFVFLATDDDSTVKEARKDAQKNGYRLLFAPVDRKWYSLKTWEKNRVKYSKGMVKSRRESEHFKVGFIERRLGAGDGDPGRVGTETATDVELLASGDAFIGTFTSNLGRLAFEVMSARLQKVPPFASVDGKGWYYGQSKCREKNSKKPCPVATWMHSRDSSHSTKKKAVIKVSATSAAKNSKTTTKVSKTILAASKRASNAKIGVNAKTMTPTRSKRTSSNTNKGK
jgi:hypothetical protein